MLTKEQLKILKQVDVSKNAEKTKIRFKEDFSSSSSAVKNQIVELSGQRRNSIYRVYRLGVANARLVLAMSISLNISPLYYTGEIDDKEPLKHETVISFIKDLGYKKLHEELKESVNAKKKRTYNRKPSIDTDNVKLPDEKTNDEEPIYQESSANDQLSTQNIADAEFTVSKMTDDVAVDKSIDLSGKTKPAINTLNSNISIQHEWEAINISLRFPSSPEIQKYLSELNEDDAVLLLKSLLLREKLNNNVKQLVEVIKLCLMS